MVFQESSQFKSNIFNLTMTYWYVFYWTKIDSRVLLVKVGKSFKVLFYLINSKTYQVSANTFRIVIFLLIPQFNFINMIFIVWSTNGELHSRYITHRKQTVQAGDAKNHWINLSHIFKQGCFNSFYGWNFIFII